tara:strand:- start:593 stop:769 length:177 start_codon:yes stop_codon:yes gene_type:complete
MEPNESSLSLFEAKKRKERMNYDSNRGITKTLLEKYKPIKNPNILNSCKKDIKTLRAA